MSHSSVWSSESDAGGVARDRAGDGVVVINGPRHPCDTCMTCHAVGGKGGLSSTGWVRVEGWLLVETGRGVLVWPPHMH